MKSVIASIRPIWCDKIKSRDKTIEIRKTAPEPPFKCYIYETKTLLWQNKARNEVIGGTGGKIIGEFICDKIVPIVVFENGSIQNWNHYGLAKSCVDYATMADYIGYGNTGYGWHISDLVIYEEPKELKEFYPADVCPYLADNCTYPYHCFRAGQAKRCGGYIERAPQSWRYVVHQSDMPLAKSVPLIP